MKKKLYQLVLLLFLSGAALHPVATYSQVVPGPSSPVCLCDNVPWGPVQTYQFYFNPMAIPGCIMFAEITYRTKTCNGMLMYEIVDEEFTQVSGSCNFAVCIYAELFKDVEKEMILNVFGTTNVYSAKPSACYRLLELDPSSDPNFNRCWTNGGAMNPTGNPMTYVNCSNFCCVSQASVWYDAGGKAWVSWTPVNNVPCDESIPVPTQLTYSVCCETVVINGENVCNDWQFFTVNVLQNGPCQPFCNGSMQWKQSNVTSLEEANELINANIRFFQNAKAVPNPSKGNFDLTIVLPNNQPVTVELLDMSGKLVKEYQINYNTAQHQYAIDAQELKSGIYLCRINTLEFGDKMIKVVKE